MKLKITVGFAVLIMMVVICSIYSCQSDEQIEFERYYSAGSLVYQSHCQNCHGTHGEGLQALIPPLTDSGYLKKNNANLACFIKYGLTTKITINNREFDEKMLPNDLPPIDIANVLTYINNSFGNKLGTTPVKQVENNLATCR